MPAQVAVVSKAIWESKTFWFGASEIMGGLAILTTDYLDALQAGQPVGWAFIAKGALTIILRLLSTRPVTPTGGDAVTMEVDP